MKRIFGVFALVIMVATLLTGCGYDVPRPKIKHGEFDLSVTYEFNGEVKTLSCVYVCDYDGLSWALDGGFSRSWKGYIKGGEIEEPIKIGTTENGETVDLVLGLYPDYFMGDFVEGYLEVPKPCISVTLVGEGISFMQDADEVEEYCGARIISYKYEEPIKNSFSLLG